jgi:urea transport system permease protein
MFFSLQGLRTGLLGLCGLFLSMAVQALSMEQARGLSVGDTDARLQVLQQVLQQADPATAVFLQAMADDNVKVSGDTVWMLRQGQPLSPVDASPQAMPDDAQDVISNNRMRGEIDAALAALKLLSPDKSVRMPAAQALIKEPDAAKAPLIEKALAMEKDAEVAQALRWAQAAIHLGSPDAATRARAAQDLAQAKTPQVQLLLNQQWAQESDAVVKAQIAAALRDIQAALAWGERWGVVFTGLSLGSILLLVALGLAITYGLMGVINMAHGELMMVGAYATFVVQGLFRQYLPNLFDAYLIAALPVSFFTAAVVGAALERGVLRHLYGRPLETLLATWGISLMLMQAVRSIFGAQNVAVENPSWMSGGVQVLANLVLPWNRLFIVLFALLVLVAMALLISQTRLGLFVRGVTQNRAMASCMGVHTARIDTTAFALGSGIAGLAGCALSQVGNVGPDLGQGYIVDAFMVVVLGGVGQLAGTVYAALGLGVLNKFLEGWTGAVLAKIAVLVFIIVFIQKRPQGLFAMKGRSAEA